ncbi:unnamed protein product [Moneuplotes crassus]|uniref:Uncharacterized protein n=1 Tax=Euplotes crassus TaxID=5936 RepID=A0AAD1URS4_EUPCR|nr:unnamed protein product [Moneuplotes crassus]
MALRSMTFEKELQGHVSRKEKLYFHESRRKFKIQEMKVLLIPKNTSQKHSQNISTTFLKLDIPDLKSFKKENSCNILSNSIDGKTNSVSVSGGSRNFPSLKDLATEISPYTNASSQSIMSRKMNPRMDRFSQLIKTKQMLKLHSRNAASLKNLKHSVSIPTSEPHQLKLFSNQRIKSELGSSMCTNSCTSKPSKQRVKNSKAKLRLLQPNKWKLRKEFIRSIELFPIDGRRLISNVKKSRSKSKCFSRMNKTGSKWSAQK